MMGGDLTDDIDDLESNLNTINHAITPLFKQLADLRKAVVELQEDLKYEENRNEDYANQIDYYVSFIKTQPDLFVAWQVTNRMGGS